jgi:hypothetical protein
MIKAWMMIPQVSATPIDIGPAATNRANTATTGLTFLDANNPANADGHITSVELWFETDATGVKVGTFYGSAITYTMRSYATIGNVTSGSKQTFTGLSIDVVSGDWIGIYAASGGISFDSSGGTAMWWGLGDLFDAGSKTYSNLSGYIMSSYGSGLA